MKDGGRKCFIGDFIFVIWTFASIEHILISNHQTMPIENFSRAFYSIREEQEATTKPPPQPPPRPTTSSTSMTTTTAVVTQIKLFFFFSLLCFYHQSGHETGDNLQVFTPAELQSKRDELKSSLKDQEL